MTTRTKNLGRTALFACLASGPGGLAVSASAAAATIAVTSCKDDASGGTLRETLQGIHSGDTVDMSSLVCASNTVTLSAGRLEISVDDLTLKGPARPLVLSGGNLDRVLEHTGNGTLTVQRLIVKHGSREGMGADAKGGCIYSAGSVTLSGATVTGCTARDLGTGGPSSEGAEGGGVFARQKVALIASTVSGNLAEAVGGSHDSRGGGVSAGEITSKYSAIMGNRAESAYKALGGGAFAFGSITITGSTIAGNLAGANSGFGFGGGLYPSGSSLVALNSTISGNFAGTTGGGISSNITFVSLSNSTVAFNGAGFRAQVFIPTSKTSYRPVRSLRTTWQPPSRRMSIWGRAVPSSAITI